MKASEFKNLTPQELEDKLKELRKTLYELRSQGATGRIEKPSKVKQVRKDIARILTVLNEKE